MVSQVHFQQKITELIHELDTLHEASTKSVKTDSLRAMFSRCRMTYKETELFIEYYFQGLTKRINGPALPDVKTEDGQVWPPHGLQVMEQYLFTEPADSNPADLQKEIRLLQADLKFILANLPATTILPQHAKEIVQHELIRIVTQGITGFDSPISLQSIPETIAALNGIRQFQKAFYGEQASATWEKQIDTTIARLQQEKDFDTMDRLALIADHLMPLSQSLASSITDAKADSLVTKPFRGTLDDLMKGRGFNPDYYTTYAEGISNTEKVALGKRLFYDQRLSASTTLSCGSCHRPELFFTDGKVKAEDFIHGGSLQRNTPGLFYAAMQSHQFYDLRSTTLEDQAHQVIFNKDEFNFSDTAIVNKLTKDSAYGEAFSKAFPKSDKLSGYEVRNAIGAYVRSLMPFRSRWDQYMQGNKEALTAEEKHGFTLFAGKAKCATCHFIPLFNGNIPPWYTKSESEIIGVPQQAVWTKAIIDPDSGRYRINPISELAFAFKTPTIRNIEKTGPYMHNGVYTSLDDVVEFYHRGGGVGLGIDLPFQTLPFDSLILSKTDKKAIVAFMRSLTDETPAK
ncbi:MAG: cytochrome-c peroxidase [Sphingobacteriales bacterium]|jgi:cytochrome c peroxidase